MGRISIVTACMVPFETYLPEWWITRVLSGDIERPLYRRHSASVPLRRDDISVVGLEFACEHAENQRTQQMNESSICATYARARSSHITFLALLSTRCSVYLDTPSAFTNVDRSWVRSHRVEIARFYSNMIAVCTPKDHSCRRDAARDINKCMFSKDDQ